MADIGAYPATTFAAMKTAIEAGKYMVTVPTKDPWGINYIYTLAASTYTLTSYGPNGVAGTDDIVIINGQLQGT
jgi:hypothetical protein